MSTMSPGGGSPEFEKLIALARFVQMPGYLDRVKELQALEASSKAALEQANAAIQDAAAAKTEHDKREAAIKQREDKLASMEQAHLKKVALLAKAIGEAR